MVAIRDIQLAEETARDLRAQGQRERAAAVEALLALASLVSEADEPARGVWTVREAARTTGLSGGLIHEWIDGGELPALIRGGRTFVRPQAVWACADRLAQATPPPAPSARDARGRRRHHESLVAGLPRENVARQEALLKKTQRDGQLSRAECKELIALENQITAAAAQLLRPQAKRPARRET